MSPSKAFSMFQGIFDRESFDAVLLTDLLAAEPVDW